MEASVAWIACWIAEDGPEDDTCVPPEDVECAC